MKTTNESILSGAIEAFQDARESARRERKARELKYVPKLVENFNYSPREFYTILAQNLEKRCIPGLTVELVQMRESIAGSPQRLYLMAGRERFVFYVCAAPFGSGFFFSWRFVDERQPAEWHHVVGAFVVLILFTIALSALLTGPLKGMLQPFGVESQRIRLFDSSVSSIVGLLFFAVTWSAMRLASLPGYERAANFIERLSLFGRVFERFYRPDTYYRQDTAKMYEEAFDCAVTETIAAVTNPQGVRHTGQVDGGPVVNNLHRR